MEARSVNCLSCGKSAAGNFCSHCGAPLVAKCPSCGAPVKPGSRACSQCGASLVARAVASRWTAQSVVPWAALGLASVALVSAWLPRLDRGGSAPPAPELPAFSESASFSSTAPGQPPDLASMTPREAADRLFNRVMSASESGNTEEALRFAPMAIQAYDRVETLDNDARYHVALLHLTAGDRPGVRAQLAQLRQSAPRHLLGFMVEHDLAERSGDQTGAARAYRNFLAAYDAEIATARAEYQDHRSSIERFRLAAQAGTAARK
jgi:hypothetical protein